MKKIITYIGIVLILSSCGMSNNFNSQKFTSLKKIKPQKTEQYVEEGELASNFKEEECGLTQIEPLNSLQESTDQPASAIYPQEIDQEVEIENHYQQERNEVTSVLQKELPDILADDKEFEQEDVDKLAKASRILFWIGIAAAFIQLAAFVATVLIDASLTLLGGWMPLMFVTLIAAAIAAICLLSAVIISYVYKSKAKRRNLEYDKSSWRAIIITGMTIGIIFLGNLFFTFSAFVSEFF